MASNFQINDYSYKDFPEFEKPLQARKINEREFAVLFYNALVIFDNDMRPLEYLPLGGRNDPYDFLPTPAGDFIVAGNTYLTGTYPSQGYVGKIKRAEFLPVPH